MQSNFLHHLLHLSANTPDYALRHEAGWTSMKVRVFKLILNFLERILKIPQHRVARASLQRVLEIGKMGKGDQKLN